MLHDVILNGARVTVGEVWLLSVRRAWDRWDDRQHHTRVLYPQKSVPGKARGHTQLVGAKEELRPDLHRARMGLRLASWAAVAVGRVHTEISVPESRPAASKMAPSPTV